MLDTDHRSSLETESPSIAAPEEVIRALESILASVFFRGSKRSQQFLSYVVQYRLDGNLEPLKERTIGTDLFKRPVGYATGDDSVVRVQAGEVRRRLEQFYQAPPVDCRVRIELPLGSYAPEFHEIPVPQPTPTTVVTEGAAAESLASEAVELATREFDLPVERNITPGSSHGKLTQLSILGMVLVLAIALAGFAAFRLLAPNSALKQFWAPGLASSKPILICLAKPILYRPSVALFGRNQQVPGEFDSEVDRFAERPRLNPEDKIAWSDMLEYPDFGVAKGDVEAAFAFSHMLDQMGKESELRIGSDYTYDDLRNAPAILIGAFSNKWSMKLTANLHFSFVEDHTVFRIQEKGANGRAFYAKLAGYRTLTANAMVSEDYGLVTRLLNSDTGQFVVVVAGITAVGSQAAAEVAVSPEALRAALKDAPADWEQKNVQILVKAVAHETVAGPPQIVSTYIW
jgi:hypothetical protein